MQKPQSNDTPIIKPLSQTIQKPRQREYNCHDCGFQGTNSKNLKRHVRESQHSKFDSLHETCHTCGQTSSDFEQLKISHPNIINECRYFRESRCNWGSDCWYRHGISANEALSQSHNISQTHNQNMSSNLSQNATSNPNFHSVNTGFPPDKLETVVRLLTELVMSQKSQQSREDSSKRRLQGF